MTTKPNRRPVGRPRTDGKPHLSRARVFAVCARLIAEHGFAGTGIRLMAKELGASPASLFHLFGSKDGLLDELIAFAAAPSIAFHDRMRSLDVPPAVALYRSVHEETRTVAAADRDHAALFYLPELRKPQFAAAQAVRARMVGFYRELIDAGTRSSALRPTDPALAAEQVFQLTETSIIAASTAVGLGAEAQATAAADFCLRALLSDPDALPRIATEASALSERIEATALDDAD